MAANSPAALVSFDRTLQHPHTHIPLCPMMIAILRGNCRAVAAINPSLMLDVYACIIHHTDRTRSVQIKVSGVSLHHTAGTAPACSRFVGRETRGWVVRKHLTNPVSTSNCLCASLC